MIKHKDLTPTDNIILRLTKRLPKLIGQPFTIYLNNYFTSINLFRILRDLEIEAYNTTRVTSSDEEYPTLLKEIKEDYLKAIS
jgi:hypothetical protein